MVWFEGSWPRVTTEISLIYRRGSAKIDAGTWEHVIRVEGRAWTHEERRSPRDRRSCRWDSDRREDSGLKSADLDCRRKGRGFLEVKDGLKC